VFFVVVLAVVAGIFAYLWLRLVRDTTSAGRARWLGTAGVVAFGLLVVGALVGTRALPAATATPLAWAGYLGLALMFYLLVVLAVLEVPRLVLRRRVTAEAPVLVGAEGPPVERVGEVGGLAPDPSRRLFLGRVLAGAAVVTAAGTVGYGVTQATGRIPLRRVAVRLDRLAPAFDGYRIALLTDIHLGPILGREFLADVVAQVNRAGVDMVAISGDLVDGDTAGHGDDARPLADLTSRDGTYFVTGNHEYYSGAQSWTEYLDTLGVRVLRNERVEIRRGDAAFDLAGVDDYTAGSAGVPGHGADLPRALEGRDPSRAVVLLAHQPRLVEQAADAGVDLQLAGHTHGGQMAPFNLFVPLQQPAVSGLHRFRRTWLYVSRGVGFWGPPVRVGAPPEITILTLRSQTTIR
jgi:predicted MPP superfamily phosphohydrolase